MLDLGANVDCSPQHLLQFAVMGSALVSVLDDKERPSIGLLNIGEEAIKGNDVVKEAAELIRATHLNFYGNVEGNDIYRGVVDVIVCDGFVGNVALKTSEGVAQMVGGFLREEFSRNAVAKSMALLASSGTQPFQTPYRSSHLQRRQPDRACAASSSRAMDRPMQPHSKRPFAGPTTRRETT